MTQPKQNAGIDLGSRFALTEAELRTALGGISKATLDQGIHSGTLPGPLPLPGKRVYSVEAVRSLIAPRSEKTDRKGPVRNGIKHRHAA